MEEITAEQIAQHYKAMGDSVDLLNAGQPEGMDDAEWADCVDRNVRHLEIMVAKDFWTDEDMTAVNAAIEANQMAVSTIDPANYHYDEIMRQVNEGTLTIADAE